MRIKVISMALAAFFILFFSGVYAQAERLVVDDFEGGKITNLVNGKTNVYQGEPSRAMVANCEDNINGKQTKVLMIKYDKKGTGGKADDGGWCGYYTILKCSYPAVCLIQGKAVVEPGEIAYLNASKYKNITFMVKGAKGAENFSIGVADSHWDQIGDSVKSQEIGKYLPAGKITAEWQKATVPLDEFFVDFEKLSAITINFESHLFAEGTGEGAVYIDEIAFE